MSLADIAKANHEIIARGSYRGLSGHHVDIRDAVTRAIADSRLYRPNELHALLDEAGPAPVCERTAIELDARKTGEAAREVAAESGEAPCALNFASASKPGGGYLNGRRAQEEDLARCSALYYVLAEQRDFYAANRRAHSAVYTHDMVFSPLVPFFRDERYELLDQAVSVSVITAPAPNAGEALRRDLHAGPEVERWLRRRAGLILALAQHHRCKQLVLGAWGCGVFENDPAVVADAFATWLETPRFAGAFDRVVFAIYERDPEQPTLRAFRDRFGR